ADYLNYSSDLFVVREEFYEQNKDTLRRFVTAYRNSVQWMQRQPEEAAQLAIRRAIDGQNLAVNEQIIALRNRASVSELTAKRGLGVLDVDSLQAAADAYYELGLISRRLSLNDIVATDLSAASD